LLRKFDAKKEFVMTWTKRVLSVAIALAIVVTVVAVQQRSLLTATNLEREHYTIELGDPASLEHTPSDVLKPVSYPVPVKLESDPPPVVTPTPAEPVEPPKNDHAFMPLPASEARPRTIHEIPYKLSIQYVDGMARVGVIKGDSALLTLSCDRLVADMPGGLRAIGNVTITAPSLGYRAQCKNLAINLDNGEMVLQGNVIVHSGLSDDATLFQTETMTTSLEKTSAPAPERRSPAVVPY
jgi:hypothetical protein